MIQSILFLCVTQLAAKPHHIWRSLRQRTAVGAGLLFCLLTFSQPGLAETLTIAVSDASTGDTLNGAVIELYPLGTMINDSITSLQPSATMEQRDMHFFPHVLAVAVGTAVSFPNHDKMRHHVYSLSPPKVFNTRLYLDDPQPPVIFDKPGVVVIGCNIHDRMQAYIVVSDAPYFATTEQDGIARFARLPKGSYRMAVWHPRLNVDEKKHWQRDITLTADQRIEAALTLTVPPRQDAPESALQRRFREATSS